MEASFFQWRGGILYGLNCFFFHVKGILKVIDTEIGVNTVTTQSFRTAERSLWENGFFENSPKIKFSSDENYFWPGGL
jgi:hypothetical protein